MKNVVVLVIASMALAAGAALAQPVQINQAAVAASGSNRPNGGFPYMITQPGSYQLTGNLTVPNANTSAIVIAANNVTLDLNGFSILGPVVCAGFLGGPNPPSCTGAGNGYGVDGSRSASVTVLNGMVRGMGAGGIRLGSGSLVDKVHADSNGFSGISAFDGTISNSSANRNGGAGILLTNSGTLYGSSASNNGLYGLYIEIGSMHGNSATNNYGYGIYAFCPSSLVNNTSFGNGPGFNLNIFFDTSNGPCSTANNAGQ
jgi:hypothetical protein